MPEAHLNSSLVLHKAAEDAAHRAFKHLQQLTDSAQSLGMQKMKAQILADLATVRRRANDLAEARRLFNEARASGRALGAERLTVTVTINLAELEFGAGDAATAAVLANEAIAALEPQSDPRPAATALNNLSAYLTALGRCDEARNYARQALALARDVQFGVSVAISLQHVAAAALFCAAPDGARAARLLGYANAQVVELEAMREYTEQQEYDKMIAALRDAFGENELAKLMAEGSAWSEDQAVAEAMLI